MPRMRYVSLLLAGSWCAAAAVASPLTDWNLVVRNDVHSTSEVDGSALIGGSVHGTSNYAVQGVTASNGDGLAVAGDINAPNIQVNNGGNLRLGGTSSGNLNLNGGGSLIHDGGVSNTVAAAFAFAQSISAHYAGLTTNGTLDGAGNMNANAALMGGQYVAVYSINASSLNGLGQLNLNMGNADTVIINVDGNGGSVNFQAPPNFVGGLNQNNSSRILWNFIDTTEVVVNNNFNGAILALDANLRLLGGGINGTVIVDNISQQSAEIRRHTFVGYVPEPDEPIIPLPTGGALALVGMGLIAARRSRAV